MSFFYKVSLGFALCISLSLSVQAEVMTITDNNFEEKIYDPNTPAVLLFSADWSGPARIAKINIEKLPGEFGDKINVGVMDVDKNINIPSRYAVSALPYYLFLKNGQVVAKIAGPASLAQIQAKVKERLLEE